MRTNQPHLAIATAEQAYRRFREPRLMFVAMETATQQADWDRLEHLLTVAGQDEAAFSRSERYWLLKAHSESHTGRKSAALSHYARALNLNPGSESARVAWLWLAIDGGDKQQLATSLRDWRNEADKDPAYWGAYAAALLALQRPKESLPWFERQARAKPNDYLWLLTYADALQRSGHESESWRLRRHVLLQIRREGLSAGKGEAPGDLALQKAYARLVNDFAGADAGGKAIQALLTQGPHDPQVREMLIAHHLSQENYGAARYWLMRAHTERQTTPAWQELALAFAEDDMKAVERLLDERSLSPGDRIQALRRLGRDEQALVEARGYASGR
jgi:predicted Zn-dependent protease